jgi:hypothetical protein
MAYHLILKFTQDCETALYLNGDEFVYTFILTNLSVGTKISKSKNYFPNIKVFQKKINRKLFNPDFMQFTKFGQYLADKNDYHTEVVDQNGAPNDDCLDDYQDDQKDQ